MSKNINSITERLIKDAGISKGVRVLDLGCGNGEVSLLLAKAVGPSGEVIGVDKNERAIMMARERVVAEKIPHVTFLNIDISNSLPEVGLFDAVIGRRVLMYVLNPAEVIRNISAALKPGGVIAFQENDSTIVPGRLEPLPLHEKVNGWIWRTLELEGANLSMGFNLPSVLEQAGFVVESVRAEAIIQGQNSHDSLAVIIRMILPRIIRYGVATEAEVDIETLEQRLRDERPASSVFISDLVFSVWARK